MKYQATAPSNIALIKYMGRQKAGQRVPANASLSYTLANLKSCVELEFSAELSRDIWQPYAEDAVNITPLLSEAEQARFLNHLAFLKKQFNFNGHFIVRSANNFQAACGLASSASSFAALTRAAIKAFSALCPERFPADFTEQTAANWSRQASGSSCRSFFGPWVIWEGKSVVAVDLPYPQLIHQVVLIDTQKKAVSSSEAHARVLTSPLFEGRAERASLRLTQLLGCMREKNWPAMYAIVRDEFLDMHYLFETAEQAFTYRQEDSLRVLDFLENYWRELGDGPLVTMDAGPNVHLLFRPDQVEMMRELKKQLY